MNICHKMTAVFDGQAFNLIGIYRLVSVEPCSLNDSCTPSARTQSIISLQQTYVQEQNTHLTTIYFRPHVSLYHHDYLPFRVIKREREFYPH